MSDFNTVTGATGRVTIKLATIEQEDFVAACRRRNINLKSLPPINFEGLVDVNLETIDADELAAAYESNRFAGAWLTRIYRALAEYDCETAMDELYAQFGSFGLPPPPYVERALVDKIQGFKDDRHAQN